MSSTKKNLTLSAFNTALNPESQSTVTFTAPWNSRLIRAISSMIRRRSSPMYSTAGSTDRLAEGERKKLSRRTDKHREEAGLRVERAAGIQGRPPSAQPTTKFTSWIFGNLEKSKDCSGAPRSPMSEDGVSDTLKPAGPGEGAGFTIVDCYVRQLHEGFAARFREPHSQVETPVHTTNLQVGKTQPSWDLR